MSTGGLAQSDVSPCSEVNWNYLSKGVSAACAAALWSVPTEESELRLPVRNLVRAEVTLGGVGFDTLVQGEGKPFLKFDFEAC